MKNIFVASIIITLISGYAYADISDCDSALREATFSQLDVKNTDWRLASTLTKQEWDKKGKSAQAAADIFKVSLSGGYDEYTDAVKKYEKNFNSRLNQDQIRNVLWKYTDPGSTKAYSDCLEAASNSVLILSVIRATENDISFKLRYKPQRVEDPAIINLQWSPSNIHSLVQGMGDALPDTISQSVDSKSGKTFILSRPVRAMQIAANYIKSSPNDPDLSFSSEPVVLVPLPQKPPKPLDISGVIVTSKGKTTISQDGFEVQYTATDDCCTYTFKGAFIDPQTVKGVQTRLASNFNGGPCRIDSNVTIKVHSTRNFTAYENFIPDSHPVNNTCGVKNFNPAPKSYTY